MNVMHNPTTMSKPQGPYTQGIEVSPGARWLCTAGQVGVTPDGTLAEGSEAQCEWAFRNVISVLEAAGMENRDMVKLDIFLVRPEHFETYRAIRERMIGNDAKPTGTLIYVPGLGRPEWLIEVQAWAAQP